MIAMWKKFKKMFIVVVFMCAFVFLQIIEQVIIFLKSDLLHYTRFRRQ